MLLNRLFAKSLPDSFLKAENDNCVADDRAMRDALSERQIDSMINHSFPASDPPSTY